MSSQRGAGLTRKRAQKHKNTFAFKNDLHDKTPQMKKINALHVSEVCERCKAQIEWKIKYKKYKPLSQAKTCIKWVHAVIRLELEVVGENWFRFLFISFRRCNQRTVKKAYHVCCKDCAKKERICAKCMSSADQVNIEPPEPTPQEAQQLQVEMDRLIKSLSERKRRTFQRFMKRGKEVEGVVEGADKEVDAGAEDGEVVKKRYVPHNRETLLNKIESLKLADEDDDDDFSFDDSDFGSNEEDGDEDEEDDDEIEEGGK